MDKYKLKHVLKNNVLVFIILDNVLYKNNKKNQINSRNMIIIIYQIKRLFVIKIFVKTSKILYNHNILPCHKFQEDKLLYNTLVFRVKLLPFRLSSALLPCSLLVALPFQSFTPHSFLNLYPVNFCSHPLIHFTSLPLPSIFSVR